MSARLSPASGTSVTEVDHARRGRLQRVLLLCGIGYGAAYVIANDVIAASIFDGYSRTDQAISELSATEAPSRAFLAGVLPVFALLVLSFGVGVWRAAGPSRALRVTAGVLVAQALMFPVWLLFPMSSREQIAAGAGGGNDVGHIVLSGISVLLIVTEMATSGAALGKHFRYFALAMAIATVVAGAYTGTTTDEIEAGDPTPWMGFIERISYGAWLLWMTALAVVLLRRSRESADTESSASGTAA